MQVLDLTGLSATLREASQRLGEAIDGGANVRIPLLDELEGFALMVDELAKGTPSSRWKIDREEDPHEGQYDQERAQLALGNLTDDELANGAFLNYDQPFDAVRAMARDPNYHPPIVWMTAVKERIRWFSRALEKEIAQRPRQSSDLDIDQMQRVAFESTNNGPHVGAMKHWYRKGVRDTALLRPHWTDMVEGKTVSMDVSTGEEDAGNRIFGRVSEVMTTEGGSAEDTILAIEEERNF